MKSKKKTIKKYTRLLDNCEKTLHSFSQNHSKMTIFNQKTTLYFTTFLIPLSRYATLSSYWSYWSYPSYPHLQNPKKTPKAPQKKSLFTYLPVNLFATIKLVKEALLKTGRKRGQGEKGVRVLCFVLTCPPSCPPTCAP